MIMKGGKLSRMDVDARRKRSVDVIVVTWY